MFKFKFYIHIHLNKKNILLIIYCIKEILSFANRSLYFHNTPVLSNTIKYKCIIKLLKKKERVRSYFLIILYIYI